MPEFGTVAILGATGMLGSQVVRTFQEFRGFRLRITARDPETLRLQTLAQEEVYPLDAETATIGELQRLLVNTEWCINCIGVIHPYIQDNNPATVERALRVNGLFPHLLAKAATLTETRVIQIATDCVWDGAKGNYTESDPHNPQDVYGKTKSLSEVQHPGFYNIRCSIVGREDQNHLSLLDWFLGQEPNAKVRGFRNHHWNGVTTLHFAKICYGIMKFGLDLSCVQHLVPDDQTTKEGLLKLFAHFMERDDITIQPYDAEDAVNRTIITSNPDANRRIWHAAGYDSPPTLETMISELAEERRD